MSTQTRLVSMCVQMGLPTAGVDNPEAVPVLLVASPGCAKTEYVKGLGEVLAKHLDQEFPVETMAMAQMAAEHIAGLPVPNRENQTTDLYVLSIGKNLIKAGRGILFLDEFSSAADNVAAASLTLVQSGMLGDAKLPSSVARVLAMNDPEKATAGRPLAAPESNRMCWINWELEVDSWIDYMKGGKGALADVVILPENWERDYYAQAASLVTAFIRSAPARLLREPEPHKAGCAWPSPRSWRNATRLLAACYSLGEKVNSALTTAAITGCVGDDAAAEFLVYAHKLDLPDPEDVLAAGPTYEMPKRDDKLLCILESVAAVACLPKPDMVKRWERACDIIEAVSETRFDVSLPVIQYLMLKKPKDVKVPKLALKYQQLMSELGLVKK